MRLAHASVLCVRVCVCSRDGGGLVRNGALGARSDFNENALTTLALTQPTRHETAPRSDISGSGSASSSPVSNVAHSTAGMRANAHAHKPRNVLSCN